MSTIDSVIFELIEEIITKSADEWITTMEEEDPKLENKDLDTKLDGNDDEGVMLSDIIAKLVDTVCIMEVTLHR